MAGKQAQPKPKLTTPSLIKKEISTNNFIALVAVGSLLTLLIAGYFGFLLVKENIRNGRVIAGKIGAQNDLKQKLEDANQVVHNYNSLSSVEKQLIASAMPVTPDFAQIVSLVESAGNTAGVKIKAVTAKSTEGAIVPEASASPEATAGVQGSTATAVGSNIPKPFSFTITLEGPYPKVTQFFKNLELSVRPLKVTIFELRGSTALLTGDLTVETFYQDKADISDKTEVVK